MRNALFFDIDGTLLSDVTGKIPDSALDALKKTIELGNLTFINTGRCYCSVPMELKRAPFSGYLCGCGTYIMLGDVKSSNNSSLENRKKRNLPIKTYKLLTIKLLYSMFLINYYIGAFINLG